MRIDRIALAAMLCAVASAGAQTRDEKVHNDRKKVEARGLWIYNDLPKAFSDAKTSGKPILVVLRCIPCEECVKLDDELLDQDERVRPLLDKFVRVRVVSTNGLDLSQFQFDTDQSFAVFFLNADGTVYGRFGTRSHRTVWTDDVSVEGLAKAMKGALALHAAFPKNKEELTGKKGPAPEFRVPEQFPTLKGKYGPKLDYTGNVVRSCIHCHQIGDAQREFHRGKGAIPEPVLFPYPHPKAIGLILDPKERATVLRVEESSPAAKSGFRPGDILLKLGGQALLSIADVQWVLHHASADGTKVTAEIRRGEATLDVTLELPRGWRRKDDISWRASTWGLRRIGVGGLLLKDVPADERTKLDLAEADMALRVEHVGQYSPHDVAKRAGFQKGDVILSFDDKSFARETDVLAYALNECKPGAKIRVVVLRGDKRVTLMLPIPS
jgi:serine protease Do